MTTPMVTKLRERTVLQLLLLWFFTNDATCFLFPLSTQHLGRRTSVPILMGVANEVNEAIKTAMKAKDSVTLSTARSIKTAFTNQAKESGLEGDLDDDTCVIILRKLAKQRQESIDMYTEAGADDRAASEKAELQVIERWLPSLADEAQTKIWIEGAMGAAEAAGAAGNVGRIMGFLMKDHKGDVDGKLAQKLLKNML